MDNVLILGVAKSGTTFLYYTIKDKVKRYNDSTLIFEGATQQDGHVNPITKKRGPILAKLLLDDVEPEWEQEYLKQSPLKNIKSPDQVFFEMFAEYQKKIHLLRDPRDSLISRFFWHYERSNFSCEDPIIKSLSLMEQKERDPSSVNFKTLLDVLKDHNKPVLYDDTLLRHIDLYKRSIPQLINKKWFTLKYKDLVQGKLKPLEEYLGFDLKRNKNIVGKEFGHLARTKSFDNWRNFFTEEDVEWLHPIYYDILEKLGYDPDDWNLSKKPHLEASSGSDYIKKLYYEDPIGSILKVGTKYYDVNQGMKQIN